VEAVELEKMKVEKRMVAILVHVQLEVSWPRKESSDLLKCWTLVHL